MKPEDLTKMMNIKAEDIIIVRGPPVRETGIGMIKDTVEEEIIGKIIEDLVTEITMIKERPMNRKIR